jgi:hypothetical protein
MVAKRFFVHQHRPSITRRSRNQEGCQGLRTPDPGLRVKPWFAARKSGLARGPESEAQVVAILHNFPAKGLQAFPGASEGDILRAR